MSGAPAIVVMGVSGCGKSSIGAALAVARGMDFVDGDALHPPANVAKMRAGHALTDADRAPWLDAVAAELACTRAHPAGVVVACSALKRAYRDHIRRGAPLSRFLYLSLPQAVALARVAARPGHFMPASLVADQFATLEVPGADEADVVTIDAARPMAETIAAALAAI